MITIPENFGLHSGIGSVNPTNLVLYDILFCYWLVYRSENPVIVFKWRPKVCNFVMILLVIFLVCWREGQTKTDKRSDLFNDFDVQ